METSYTEGGLKSFLKRHVAAVDTLAALIIALLTMTVIFYSVRFDQIRHELDTSISRATQQEVNVAVLDFTNRFIDDVLRAEQAIDFETRLQLESAVRELDDEMILAAWQQFTNAQTEREAQEAVKNLLDVLISRIQ